MRFVFPWPPSVNLYWRHNHGRTHISKEGRRYRADVWAIVASQGTNGLPLRGPVRVEIHAYPPDRRRRDVDNIGKAILDALEFAGVLEDDNQVADLRIVREGVVRGGLVEVEVVEVGNAG